MLRNNAWRRIRLNRTFDGPIVGLEMIERVIERIGNAPI
jgi:hypothetical protein